MLMKKSVLEDHKYLNYYGRVVYNFQSIKLSDFQNLFRKDELSLHGQVSRFVSKECDSILQAITLKNLIDKSIYSEIKTIGKEYICHSTYSNCFVFPKFTSNVESHTFSKNGLHIAYVGSLSSYSEIDFSCFDSLNNEHIKYIFSNGKKGSAIEINNDISLKLSQMTSLFLCETSRNPTSFLTIPMCLEISEKLYKFARHHKYELFQYTLNDLHQNSSIYNDIKDEQKKLLLKKDEENILKINAKIDRNFINTDNVTEKNYRDIEKSKIVKDVILIFFPLAIKNAVSASRYISKQINKFLKNDNLSHDYDEELGNVKDAKKLLSIEQSLVNMYKKHVLTNTHLEKLDLIYSDDIDYKYIIQEWFSIQIIDEDMLKTNAELIGKALDIIYF